MLSAWMNGARLSCPIILENGDQGYRVVEWCGVLECIPVSQSELLDIGWE